MVVSIEALGSQWVQRELAIAHDESQKRSDGCKVISVVLPGVPPGLLKPFFLREPVHIFVDAPPPRV